MYPMLIFGTVLAIAQMLWAQGQPSDYFNERKSHLEKFYQDLHMHPEVAGEEKRTAAQVASELKSLGLEVIEGIGQTGLVGILKNGKGPTTVVRAELDALPIQEETQLSYQSVIPGKMHACGHDFHLMSLVGTAFVMGKMRDRWSGTVVFLAQPAEETFKGARAMIKDGLFKKIPKPDQFLALHTAGNYPKGTIGISPGFVLANVDSVDVTFKGKGSHGSRPELGIDPFILTAEFVLKMQTLIGREKEAARAAVISVGSIHGGTTHNTIPETVKMQLTVRTYESDLREHLKKRIPEIALGLSKTAGAPPPLVEFPEDMDATFNHPSLTERLTSLFKTKFGDKAVQRTPPVMGSEDFSQYGKVNNAPSVFFWIGQHEPRQPLKFNHTPRYAPDFKATAGLSVESMSHALLELHKK